MLRRIVGRNVEVLRKKRDWNQQELSEHLNMAQNTVSKLEQGKRPVDVEELRKLGQVFGVPPTYFLERHPHTEYHEEGGTDGDG